MSLVGNLEDLGLGDIFQILYLSRRSGVLSIKGRVVEGKIFFRNGMVIMALSNIIPLDISGLLVQKGLINTTQLEGTIAILKGGGEDLLTVLNKRFHIPKETLGNVLEEGLREVVFSLFIDEGSFDFELKEVDEELREIGRRFLYPVAEPGLNPQFLAMEGCRLQDEGKLPTPEKRVEPVVPTQRPLEPTKEEGFSFEDVRKEFGLGDEAHLATVVPSPGLHLLKSMIFELQSPHSNGEITLLVLRFASEFMNRAVLFMVKKDWVEGLGQFGIVLNGGDPNKRIRGIKIPLTEPSIFHEAMGKGVAVKTGLDDSPWHHYLIRELGGCRPVEVFLAPIMVAGKVAALLYGDNAPESKPIEGIEALEIFLIQAGMALEKALLERRLKIQEKT
ncbi:MAG: DUF4388 domain-containing protein [Deltaproteobacteria bacterium]|nr:DUF4388 domain-containing protein [Deltaproteobacteria bacterium]